MPSTGDALAVGGEHLAARSRRRGCCAGRRSRTCPGCVEAPATTTPRGVEQGAELLGRSAVTPSLRTSTRASTATGAPSTTISGLRSADTSSGVAIGRRGQAEEDVDQRARGRPPARRGTRRAAPGCASSSIISSASTRVDRARAGSPTSATASARMPPTPSRTVMPNCGSSAEPGDELAVAAQHRRHEHARPRRPRAWPRRAGRRPPARTGGGVAEAQAHEAPLGLVGDGVAAQLGHDRVADRVGGGDGLVGGRRRRARPRTGTPCRRSSAFDSASDKSCGTRSSTIGRSTWVQTLVSRCQPPPDGRAVPTYGSPTAGLRRRHRGLLRPAVDVGRPASR